jgi:hypothetical protein
MATASDIVTRALKLLAITAAGETPPAEDSADGLTALNRMMHGWKVSEGIDLGHSDVVLTDTITLPDDHLEAVEYNLAVRLSPIWQAPVPPAVAIEAMNGLTKLRALYTDAEEASLDNALGSHRGARFNYNTGQ